MKTLLRLVVATLIVIGVSSCNDSWSWHQKITVSVITPDGLKIASSVTKASIGEKGGSWAPPEATGAITSLSGEAVMLQVAPGRYLFALLRNTPRAYEVFYPDEAPLEVASRLEGLQVTRELTPKQYPMLVTFDDINDPASVKLVDPADLDASFGPGYRLSSITMTITNESVTDGQVKKVLGWLSWSRDRFLAWGGGLNPVHFKDGKLTIFLDRSEFTTLD